MTNFYATLHGREFKTKKSLREAVAAGEPVDFEDTGYPFARGSCDAGDLRPFDVIVGPDPWTPHKWYAYIRAGKVL